MTSVIARWVPDARTVSGARRRPQITPSCETTVMSAANLLPRRGELLEFAVHRAPRSFHRVKSRTEPPERREQPLHPHTRRASDDPFHVYFRIGNVKQLLHIHEAPPGVIALEFSTPAQPPGDAERNCRAM